MIHLLPLLLLACLTVSAQSHRMFYRMDKDTKMMTYMSMKNDPAKMNWIIPANGTIYPWINDRKYEWGTIKKDFQQQQKKISVTTTTRRYMLSYNIVEEFIIENNSEIPVDISQLSICTPWNAHYLPFDSVQAKRCTVDVQLHSEGHRHTAVKATRCNGKGPHIGLKVTQGDISNYYTGDCTDLSDQSTCAIMYMVPEKVLLKPHKKYTLQWHIFAYNDDNDFLYHVEHIK